MSNVTLPALFERADAAYRQIKSRCQALKANISGDDVSSLTLITFHDQLVNTWTNGLSPLDGFVGLNAQAATHLINPPADYAQQFADIKAAGQALITYIENNLPQDGNGYLLVLQFGGSPSGQVWRTFTAAQLSTLDSLLDDLIAAIG